MADYFPRKTIVWTQIEDPSYLRRFTASVVAMALVTGLVLRVARVVELTHEAPSIWFILGMIAVRNVALLLAATAHLGNYTLRHWWWRAPAFGAVEGGAEMLTSLALIAAGAERVGTGSATLADWVDLAYRTVPVRIIVVTIFALILAGVVQIIRRLVLRAERRSGTFDAVQRSAEHQRATSFTAVVRDDDDAGAL